MKLIAYFVQHENTAGFILLVTVIDDEGMPKATIASIEGDDPNMQERLGDICQAYRMGVKFGRDDL